VRVDAAGHDELPAGIDHARARGCIELLADRLDLAVGAEHVGTETVLGGHHGAAADERSHEILPCLVQASAWKPDRLVKFNADCRACSTPEVHRKYRKLF
jgi:hypothetical protein